ncbi:NADH dehydrogenase [ubiquinone] 1 beta subcomplex subunit 11, mitochondrial-like [Amphibalanus amphitrite]|uniref:NADH dehydrogenase [ubiquinone] 1 beta subcomplex subunit 11, mitochondrial-like n=1 Tax=Amphibalanus amphitrite TaxID=1232801 RepID=UPI001C91E864|nr:NADH dehydrogenase [ubiquinone] 1 beta subcomplex subunit 11, mitochondrial-like [Amphibalanus amphitrite]XP_043220826.1 NADH dehydrogenase [ubiquinone] 1 beta subcomplex subunit 11, mitochondrial-like [Amphibalanus amphitrite]XP_043220827.1 NADH dehydrogenase [ubiquinone] 1 beta subcomplex subunit 11, mitochondrial-like [Amphibalanus amphitrite]XP_043220828.1 NADH dehydrogenase [ubiquinone] 1 beta subcomplex subunit 11, mitochondrial-like [Amphibalanus amphitrite]XP_043220829.1 NADH dehydro
MASLWRVSSNLLSRLGGKHALATSIRCVSTSTDKKDIIDANVTTGPIQEPHRVTLSPEAKQKLRGEVKTDQWQSFGWSIESETEDRRLMHYVFFCTVSCGIVLGSLIWAYLPDARGLDWAHREAYLQLHLRESEGRPLLDPNLIDPALIELPSDEELGDTKIII